MLSNLFKGASLYSGAAVVMAATLLMLAPEALAQTPGQQTATAETAHTAATKPAPTVTAAAATPAPLYGEYRGVKLGMGAAEVCAKLGEPEEKSDGMDFFVFSDKERARVYYRDDKASAVIATYMGGKSDAPAPEAVLGEKIEAKADGSMYKMTSYPQAGYWVAYSRTPGDEPLVIITMQSTP